MPQTRIFRDRVVSMEQTLEAGEKHLDLLKALCREALPEFEYAEHALDHERDLFVIILAAPDGRRKTVGWTRMVLFDSERIPAIIGDPLSPMRAKLVDFLRARASRPEILVTFRHLEEGWTDTPEPRREKRRGRRGRGGERGGKRQPFAASTVAAAAQPSRSAPPRPAAPRPAPPSAATGDRRGEGAPAERAAGERERPGGGRRRRFRRRRRGRGGGGGPPRAAP